VDANFTLHLTFHLKGFSSGKPNEVKGRW